MRWSAPKLWNGDCWVIGGGSSITNLFNVPENLIPDELEEFNEFGTYLHQIHKKRVIGVNLAAFLGNWVDVAFWGDNDTYMDHRNWFDDYKGLKVSSVGKFAEPRYSDIYHLYKTTSHGISEDRDALSWVGKNSGTSAINLAFHLGADRIFLLGYDMYVLEDGRAHFHAGYPDRAKTPTLKQRKQGVKPPKRKIKNPDAVFERQMTLNGGFDLVAKDAERLGIKIYNVSPNSKIESFEKINLEEALKISNTIYIKNKAKTLKEYCICGSELKEWKDVHGFPTLKCSDDKCHVIKQKVDIDLNKYYKDTYHKDIYTHSYDEDEYIAKERLKKYKKIISDGKSIDIGCGNCAFVNEARKQGIQCYGMEISSSVKDCEYVYNKELKDNNFPTDYFQNVFMHDVLEHLEDPKDFLYDIKRITKQNGTFILEFPDFWTVGFNRHWKDTEHVWFFNTEQLIRLLEEVGFIISDIYKPIKGKYTFVCKKQEETRPTILVPPGLGDIHWVLIKLQSFLSQNELGLPDVYISSFGKRDRSIEYLQMFPFLNAKDYRLCDKKTMPWREAYLRAERTIFKDVEGCDYFIAFNGQMRDPLTLEDINPELKCNYDLPMFESWEQKQYGKSFKEKHGNYIVAYFVDSGMYKNRWLNCFTEKDIVKSLTNVVNDNDLKIVLVGADWDDESTPIKAIKESFTSDKLINMVSKTNIEELFAIIKDSNGVIGFPSGVTILSTFFKVPTYILWSDYFNEVFWHATCHPKTVGTSYKYIDVATATPDVVSNEFRKLISIKRFYAVCVLKSGGDYTKEYVYKMKAMLERNITIPFEFRCFTDMELDLPEEEIVRLKQDWEGWWSKVEIFRRGIYKDNYSVVYFDLDTVITDNVDSLFLDKSDFRMLKGFSTVRPSDASGVMSFTKDLSYIYNALCKNEHLMKSNGKLNWDQHFISEQYMKKAQKRPFNVQGVVKVQSYKKHLKKGKKNGEINDIIAPIVCFHGKPRPHEVKEEWINNFWRI